MKEHKITTKDVQHVALLSRLHLREQEIEDYTRILNDILEYFAKLNQLDTEDIAASSHSINMENVFREDRITRSLSVQDALSNAPESEENCFKVPRIIQDT